MHILKKAIEIGRIANECYGDSISTTRIVDNDRMDVGSFQGTKVLAFAGTDEFSDWAENLDAHRTLWNGTEVHRGFLRVTESLLGSIAVETAGESDVIFTGHSRGGAVAMLAAMMVWPSTIGEVWTFGAPAVLGKNRKPKCGTIQRFVMDGDPVPTLPRGIFHRWYHYGRKTELANYRNRKLHNAHSMTYYIQAMRREIGNA